MLYSGTGPASYITEYTLVYEENQPGGARAARRDPGWTRHQPAHTCIIQIPCPDTVCELPECLPGNCPVGILVFSEPHLAVRGQRGGIWQLIN